MNLSTKSKILIDADLSKRMALNRMEEDKNKLSWIVAVQQSLFSPITIRLINEINQRFSDLIRSRKLFETYASKLCSTRFAHCAPAKFDSSRKLLENKLSNIGDNFSLYFPFDHVVVEFACHKRAEKKVASV